MAELVRQLAQVDSDLKAERDANRDVAVEATKKLHAYNKQYYNAKHLTPNKIVPGR